MSEPFERLQGLGEQRWKKILNSLMQGMPCMQLARVIQQDWKEFQDVSEKTLTQQLNRLRLRAAEGAFGKKMAKQIANGGTPQITRLANVSSSVLERMEELAAVTREAHFDLIEKQKSLPLPVSSMLAATNSSRDGYSKLLQDIQKVRFDLGLDEYKGVVPGARVTTDTLTASNPDGSSLELQKQVIQAYSTIEEIFARRAVPRTIEAEP